MRFLIGHWFSRLAQWLMRPEVQWAKSRISRSPWISDVRLELKILEALLGAQLDEPAADFRPGIRTHALKLASAISESVRSEDAKVLPFAARR